MPRKLFSADMFSGRPHELTTFLESSCTPSLVEMTPQNRTFRWQIWSFSSFDITVEIKFDKKLSYFFQILKSFIGILTLLRSFSSCISCVFIFRCLRFSDYYFMAPSIKRIGLQSINNLILSPDTKNLTTPASIICIHSTHEKISMIEFSDLSCESSDPRE